jgi:hypothetical protein
MLKFSPKLICGAYDLVHIWEGDDWKINFQTYYGHFEYVVMPFGLINAPIVFQHLMNDVFYEYFDDFMVCYIDDIPFFPRTWRNINDMFNLFWTSLKKLDSTLSWRNVNSIKPKWKFTSILSLEMALHGPSYGPNHCELCYPNFYSWCLMFFLICQLLLLLHCTLFLNSGASFHLVQKIQIVVWGSKVEFAFQSFWWLPHFWFMQPF